MSNDNKSNNDSKNTGSETSNTGFSSGSEEAASAATSNTGASTPFDPTLTVAATPPPSDLSALLMHSAYGRMRPIAEAIPPEKTRDILLAVGNMIETMLVAEPQMQKFRPELQKLGDFDFSNLDNLRDATYALAYMYTRIRAASGKLPPSSVATLIANRQTLHRQGISLAGFGHFEEAQVNELIKGKSHQDLAYDVIGFTNLFLDKGSALDGQTPLKRPHLIAMQAEATAMLSVIGEKDSRKSERAELSPLYRQLYTLAFNTYNEVRDALIYALRKRADAEELLKTVAPSLYEDRGRRTKPTKPPAPVPAEVEDEDEDVPAVAAIPTPAAVTDTATDSTATRAASAREPSARETRPGFPGSSPTVPEENDK
jgi:hypothetical protein